jgi:hypothetical protein
MKHLIALAALLISTAAPSLRADSLSLSFGEHAAANVFQTRYAERDWVSTLDLSLAKDLSAVSVFAGAGTDYFARNPGLSFAGLRCGLDYLRPLGAKSAICFSMTASGSIFRPDYRDFNHLSLEALGSLKSYLSPSSIVRAGYALEFRRYDNALFDFVSPAITLSLDKFFPTNTTLKAGLGWGYKYFLHPYPAVEPSPVPVGEGSQYGYGGRHGRGPGGSGYFYEPGSEGKGAGIQNLSVSGLLAQGLGSRLGLSVSGSRQWIVSGKTPYLSSEEFYLAENPTHDAFSWDGGSLSSTLTAHGPWDTELKMVYTVSEKTFPGIESMSLDGVLLGVTRKDRRRQAEVRLEKLFPRFALFLSYTAVVNRSNDPLFTWKGPFLTGGIRWDFTFGGKK